MLKKTTTVILLVFLSLDSTCQKNTLLKTWINEKNEALIISDSFLYYQEFGGLTEYDYKIEKDTLFMIEYGNTSTKEFPSYEDYRIIKLNIDTLILEYNKKWMGERTNKIERIIFIDSVKVKSIIENFTKLLLQTTYKSGTTVRSKLEVDNIGNVYYWDRNDSSDIYSLKLSSRSLDTIKKYLNVARIENNDSVKLPRVIDGSSSIFTISTNQGTIRKSMFTVPYLTLELSTYLYRLSKRIKQDGTKISKYEFLE